MKNIIAHAHDIFVSFLSLTLIIFKHSFLSSMGCSGGKPYIHSILPVAQHFRNNLRLYRSYSDLHMDLAPEQFLGTIKRDNDDNTNNSSNSNNNYNYL